MSMYIGEALAGDGNEIAHIDLMIGDKEGFQKKGKLDLEGLRTVLKLRSEYATPKKELADPAKYVDETWYRQALAGK